MRVLMLCKTAKRKAGIFLTGNLMRHSFSSVPGGRPWEFPVLGPGGSQPALPLKLCFQSGLLLCWRTGKWGFSLINRRDEVAPRRCAGSPTTSVSAVEKQEASLLPREGIKSWQMLPNRTTTRRFLSSVADLAWTFFNMRLTCGWLDQGEFMGFQISLLQQAWIYDNNTALELQLCPSVRLFEVMPQVLGYSSPTPDCRWGLRVLSLPWQGQGQHSVGTESPCSHNWGTEGWTSGTSCKGAQKSCSAWHHNTAAQYILPPSPLN